MTNHRFYFPIPVLILFAISVATSGCGTEPEELPFYSDLDLTPQWLSVDSRSYKRLPEVAAFKFTNQNNGVVNDDSVAGKVYVANFFFTTCTNICPTMRTNLTRVQEKFLGNNQVRIISHSIVPEYDDPGVLARYANINNVDSDIWDLVTGSKSEITDLAAGSYFVDLSEITSDGFAHTENLVLIDKKGHVRGVYNGTLAFEVDNLIADMELLIQ
jgi:protein SCO1